MTDYDVAVVGGGPAGCTAAVFTARYGLDTVVFDRGRSSLARCAVLENFLGFPGGVDIETFQELAHTHAETAGATIVADLVERIDRPCADGEAVEPDASTQAAFRIVTQEGDPVTARRVIAATRYDGSYLRPLGGDVMFETVDRHGEEHERFDRSYPDATGRTPIDGCYVASPSPAADRQAIVAAGHGARVALALIEDVRQATGYPEAVADHHDWLRRRAELDEKWTDRDRWREWFETAVGTTHSGDAIAEIREAEIDRRLDTYLADDEIASRVEAGQQRLLESLDDEAVLARAREIDRERAQPATREGGE